MKEGELINQLIRYLYLRGAKIWRVNVGQIKLKDGRIFKTGLPPGYSDLSGIYQGKPLFIEVKLSKGTATYAQVQFLKEVKNLGALSGIATCTEHIDNILAGGWGCQEKLEKYKGYTKRVDIFKELY